ncbi:MAG: hypothetical protein WC654_06185 [Patescibacteria group bacterium]
MRKNEFSTINIPLSGLKCLYRQPRSKKVVCEIDISHLKAVNDDLTIKEMFVEAELEYAAGMTKGFTNPKLLMAFLKG